MLDVEIYQTKIWTLVIFANTLHTRNFHEPSRISGPALGRWQCSLREHRPVDTADSWWPAPRTSRRSVSDTPVHAKLMIARKNWNNEYRLWTISGQRERERDRGKKRDIYIENQNTCENMLSPNYSNKESCIQNLAKSYFHRPGTQFLPVGQALTGPLW